MHHSSKSFDEKTTSGRRKSYWIDSTPQHPYAGPLRQNIHADVVIVGGGLAGVSVAYCLAEVGKKVVIIEDGFIGSGESGRTTAHLVTALDDRYAELEKIFGEEDTKLIAASHKAAIQFVEDTVRKENISCQFERVSGYLFLHPSDEHKSLKEEFEAATRAGVDVRESSVVPGMLNYQGRSLEFPGQAQFHPLAYMHSLCNVIEQKRGKIYTGTHAADINHEGITTSEGFTVKANHVVVATNSPVNNLVAMHLKQTAHRTYVIAGLVKKDALPKALWWDTGDFSVDKDLAPYHYIRVHPYNNEYDLLISGGEDHPTGDIERDEIQEEHRYRKLEEWTRNHFPLGDIVYCWSGQVLEPVDSLAFIGRNPLDKENVYIITGDSGTGMTHCTIGGLLITDLILGRKSPWEEIYSPCRITLKTGNIFFKELFRGVASLMKGAPDDDRVKEFSAIRGGEGKITNVAGHKCAVYREENGSYHIVSARCTHLKATLTWNADEKTWDCPWHGSRFSYDGHVINGPANTDLPVYEKVEDRTRQNEDMKEIQ
ncbi:MAG: FAD-dependent oxidoreductase [Saprospiraceae bacterium]